MLGSSNVRAWVAAGLGFLFGLGSAAGIGLWIRHTRTLSLAKWTSTDLGSFGSECRICWGTVMLDPYSEGLFMCDDPLRRPVSMGELQGKVEIRREADALTYARLVTPSSAAPGGYRLTGAGAELIPASMNVGPAPSRLCEHGVLPDEVYRRAGLAPPRVRRANGAFLVIRWIQVVGTGTRKVVERIGTDGSYRRVYLPDAPAERVPSGVVGLR
jgi:hypothetical protein